MQRGTFAVAFVLFAWMAPQAPLMPGLPGASSLRISQEDFHALLANAHPIVVDVRTLNAFREGHIPGAVLLPFEGRTSLPPESDILVARLKSATQPIVTYCACRGETTSTRVAILLQLDGVKGVRVLTGGWDDWINGHNPVEKEP
jgi:rhodanese-related sulfurtransferase